ncbi:GntR family transcriptional regulator [Paenibacillus swuensis]|uniref:GntR family transcriptional regulator n=1 Tax=Paenibacillus swuensis TaxID=1178515 RepID=A0A172TGT4_9BACL|nr:FadR/GntR family transcriptional regulator [Paenibacillus swuensis]ANE46268.1 GntR family transcriptional regulator [Paenibacillus swuensis]
MELSKLEKRNHYEEITEQLKRRIIDGTLKAGDKLPSAKELSEQFGVGRSTTREALSALKAMGYIDIRQGGGSTVITSAPGGAGRDFPELHSLRMNKSSLLELLEARHAFEVSIVRMAAAKRTEGDVAGLQSLIQQMERSLGQDLEGERLDIGFHRALAEATHNTIMVQLFDAVLKPLEQGIQQIRRVEIYADPEVSRQLLKEHTFIYDAINTRDAEAAASGMKAHLSHVERILLKYI